MKKEVHPIFQQVVPQLSTFIKETTDMGHKIQEHPLDVAGNTKPCYFGVTVKVCGDQILQEISGTHCNLAQEVGEGRG